MKKWGIAIVLLANAAFFAAGYVLLSHYWQSRLHHDQQTAREEVEAWRAKASRPPTPPPPEIRYKTNWFTWDQVESSDYRKYIANLRAVHCPEMTIRDLIMTDVMRLYAHQRGQLAHNGREFKFWETDEKREPKQAQFEQRERLLAQINKDLPAVLRELLGINYQRELDKYFVDTDEDNRRLAFLSQDKRDKVAALRDQFEARRELISYHLTNGVYSPADIAALRKIDQDQAAALGDVLSPQETEQYELCMSPTADHLRKELIGFNPTEEEFRKLFERQRAIDAGYAYQDMNDPSIRASKAADEQAMVNDVKSQLGPDRATALDRTKDPDYQNLATLTERFDLPGETAQTIADMRQAAEDEKKQLLADKDIPVERLQVALKAIQAETERATRQTLGDQAFDQYTLGANWLRNLGGE